MKIRYVIPAFLSFAVGEPRSLSSQQPRTPITIDSVRTHGTQADLGALISGALASDGTIYVLDYEQARVVSLTNDGRLQWQAGRKGAQPGEFQLPYRITVRPDGALAVFDRGTNAISTFSSEGQFLGRATLPTRFFQLDNLVITDHGEVVTSGTIATEGVQDKHGIHVYKYVGSVLEPVRSFAPLPVVRDPIVYRFWGAGSLAISRDGSLLYVRRLPYEIYHYDPSGRQHGVLRPPFQLKGFPDDQFRITRDDIGVTFSITDTVIERPGSLCELPDRSIVVNRTARGTKYWDLFSKKGGYAGSIAIPITWGPILGCDRTSNIIWLTGVHGEKSVVLQVFVSTGVDQ